MLKRGSLIGGGGTQFVFRSSQSLTGAQVFLINPQDLVAGDYIIGLYNSVRPTCAFSCVLRAHLPPSADNLITCFRSACTVALSCTHTR